MDGLFGRILNRLESGRVPVFAVPLRQLVRLRGRVEVDLPRPVYYAATGTSYLGTGFCAMTTVIRYEIYTLAATEASAGIVPHEKKGAHFCGLAINE